MEGKERKGKGKYVAKGRKAFYVCPQTMSIQ